MLASFIMRSDDSLKCKAVNLRNIYQDPDDVWDDSGWLMSLERKTWCTQVGR